MKRRGVVFDTSAALLIVIASAVLILLLLATIITMVRGEQKDIVCEFTGVLKEIADQAGGEAAKRVFDLRCPRKFILIEDKRAREMYHQLLEQVKGPVKYTYRYVDERENQLPYVATTAKIHEESDLFVEDFKRLASFEMQQCWQRAAAGDRDILNAAGLFGGKTSCMVCTEIYVDRNDVTTEPLDFVSYLQESRVPLYANSKVPEVTLYDYLYSDEPPSWSSKCMWEAQEGLFADAMTNQELIGGESYSIVYFRHGGLAAAYFDFVADIPRGNEGERETSGFCAAVAFLRTREVPQHCEVLVN